jgi:hypothetical protein
MFFFLLILLSNEYIQSKKNNYSERDISFLALKVLRNLITNRYEFEPYIIPVICVGKS